jgi:hypothetical protein
MKKLNSYTLLECIDTINATEAGNETTRGNNKKPSIFKKGEIYIAYASTHAKVNVSTFDDEINAVRDEYDRRVDNDDHISADFVYDPSLYNSPGVFNHFKVIAEIPIGEIYKLKSSGSWTESSGRMFSDSRWVSDHPYTKNYTFVDLFKDYKGYGDVKPILTIIDGKHIIGASVDITGYQTKSLTLSDSVLKLKLSLDSSGKRYEHSNSIKSNPKEYKLNKTLLILDVHGEYKEGKKPEYSIDDLKIPKGIIKLRLSNVKMTEIPKLSGADVKLSDCHVNKLTFDYVKTLSSFSDITFDEYDNDMFQCGTFGENREASTISIFKVNEDKFAVTNAKRFVTKAELSTFCSTYGLLDAIEHFGLDKNTKFEFLVNGWSRQDDEDKYFQFTQSKSGSIKLAYKNGRFSIFSMASFLWYNPRFDISWKDGKIEIGKDRIWSSDGETLNDTILAEVMKMSADDRFPRGFFTKFIRATNDTSSKHIGEIDITDFQFNMMKLPKEVPHDKLIGVHYNKDKNHWSVKYWIPKTYIPADPSFKWSRGHTNGGVVCPTIDWGQQAFKFKNNPKLEDSWFLNPEHTHYFEQLRSAGLDQTYLTESYNHKIRYDETIKYKFDIDKKKLEKSGFMFIGDQMFKECDYHLTGKETFYFTGGFYTDLCDTSGQNHGGDDRRRVSIKIEDAEVLAKKYKIKLELKSIDDDKYYTKIETIAPSKYRASRDEKHDYVKTIFTCSDAYNLIIGQQNPTAINGDSFQDTLLHNVMAPMIKIGNGLFMMWNDMLYEIKSDSKTATLNDIDGYCKSKVEIEKVLKDNNFEFSFVNLVTKDNVVDKVRKYMIKHREYLTESLLPSLTLNTAEFLFRVGFYDSLRYTITSSSSRKTEKWSAKQESVKEGLMKFGPEIREMFFNTIQRIPAIETTSNKLIEITKDLKPKK